MQSLFHCFSPRVLPVLPTASLFLPKIGIYSNSLCCLTFQDFRCTKGLKPLILCGFLSSRDFSENLFSSLKVGITTPTRNQLTGNTVRGFESLHLRHKHKGPPMRRSLVLMHEVSSDSNPRALGNLPGAGFNPRRPAPQGRSNPSISAMASEQATYRLLRLFTPAAKKSECAHSAAPPFKPATASLWCGFANQGTLAGAESALLPCFAF